MKVQQSSMVFGIVLGIGLAAAGCARVQTKVVEMPRVDQELAQGNRGYLAGKAGAVAQRKTTRQVIITDVELATGQEIKSGIRRHWPGKKQSAPQQISQVMAPAPARTPMPIAPALPAEMEDEYETAPSFESEAPAAAASSTAYVVQKNDTLEKIAKKVYGSSSKWSRIYKANRNTIKNPNRLYVGQKLTIPADEGEERRASVGGETIK